MAEQVQLDFDMWLACESWATQHNLRSFIFIYLFIYLFIFTLGLYKF